MSALAHLATEIASSYQPKAPGTHSRIGEPDTVQTILETVAAGNYLEVAADLAGISRATIYEWMKRGEAGEPPYALFSDSVKRASARAEAAEVAKVRKAGELPQYWTASMTYLERRHPDRWSRRTEPQEANRTI